MNRHQKKKHLSNNLSVISISHRHKLSAADFTLVFSDDEIKIYDIKGTNLCCSEKIRQQLLDGEVSVEALQIAASAARGEG